MQDPKQQAIGDRWRAAVYSDADAIANWIANEVKEHLDNNASLKFPEITMWLPEHMALTCNRVDGVSTRVTAIIRDQHKMQLNLDPDLNGGTFCTLTPLPPPPPFLAAPPPPDYRPVDQCYGCGKRISAPMNAKTHNSRRFPWTPPSGPDESDSDTEKRPLSGTK